MRGIHAKRPATRGAVLASVLLFTGCDWTMFRGGPARSGFSATEGTIGVDNVSTLAPKFAATTGDIVVSSPAVANGLVYVGADDNKLHAYGLP